MSAIPTINRFYVATKENFAKAIIDPTYILDVLLVRDGNPTPTKLLAPIKSVIRMGEDFFHVITGTSYHILEIHII